MSLGVSAQQKHNHDHRKNAMCEFNGGKAVMARSNIVDAPDVKAVIKKRFAPLTYELKTDTGLTWKRHVDHLKGLGTVVNDALPVIEEEVIIPTWLEERSAANASNNEPLTTVSNVRRCPYREHRSLKCYTPETSD